jgi:hypothetical protein
MVIGFGVGNDGATGWGYVRKVDPPLGRGGMGDLVGIPFRAEGIFRIRLLASID